MKKGKSIIISALMLCLAFTGCGKASSNEPGTNAPQDAQETSFDTSNDITVISREDGSGTRGAFTELFEIIEKNAEGKKIDMTVDTADITQSTGVMLTSVSSNEYAIGYVSLGSLNDSVKALKIDGAEPSIENIKNGNYKISRPFNIATKGEVSGVSQDFISFIMSEDGQKIVEEAGYISKENTGAFTSSNPSGKITVAGSSSVTPVMEKLKEAYESINGNVTIEVSQSDSTNGMNSVADGICDIGMASRDLKDSELEKGLKNTVIALDGIAVVVNNNNTFDSLTSQQVKDIYLGNTLTWAEIK